VAVARLAGAMEGGGLDDDEALPRAPLPWNLPDGYDDNPPLRNLSNVLRHQAA
jgi:hypothetical protein